MPNLFSLLSGNWFCCDLLMTVLVCFVGEVDAKELDALNLLHCNPIDDIGGVLCSPFPVVHIIDYVEGEVVVLAPNGRSLTTSR